MSQHLYIFSPSSAVRDRAAFRRGVRRLERLGFSVELDPSVLKHNQRFAGSDQERLCAIERAASSGADAVLISRGGYGLSRLLPHVPYQSIQKSVERGTHWIGLSDFTALQMAVLSHCPGTVTWAGPAVGEDFGADPKLATADQPLPDDIMEDCFLDLMQGIGEGAGWRLSAADRKLWQLGSNWVTEDALLWGGNLSMVCSLIGTPYLPQVSNGVLFLEEVGEHPYRIERMLLQLLHAGILGSQKALLMGQFTGYKPIPGYDRGFGLNSIIGRLREQLSSLPIFCGLPFGHVPTKVLLPVGLDVELTCDGRDVVMHWDLPRH